MHAVLLAELGAIILALGLLGRLATRLGQSPIPLYLLAGLAFGHGGLLPLSASEEFVEAGAEIGVVLLLLTLGLEYTAAELVTSLKTHYPAGAVDFVLNALPGAAAAFLLGWGPVAAVALAGITWVSSSGVIAKLLGDLGRVGNRETPAILSILVFEDLAMAVYLPILTALLAGAGLVAGGLMLAVALAAAGAVLFVALRHGRVLSRLISHDDPNPSAQAICGWVRNFHATPRSTSRSRQSSWMTKVPEYESVSAVPPRRGGVCPHEVALFCRREIISSRRFVFPEPFGPKTTVMRLRSILPGNEIGAIDLCEPGS